jgi:hypothetical protein
MYLRGAGNDFPNWRDITASSITRKARAIHSLLRVSYGPFSTQLQTLASQLPLRSRNWPDRGLQKLNSQYNIVDLQLIRSICLEKMVFYFKARPDVGDYTIFMGLDKYENEELIKYGFPEDIW